MRTFKYDFCCILVNRLCQLICKIIESICWVVVVAMQYCRPSALLQKYAPTACFWLFLLVAACCCLSSLLSLIFIYKVESAGVPNTDWSVLVHLAVLAKRGGCSSCWGQTDRQQLQQLIHQDAIFSPHFPSLSVHFWSIFYYLQDSCDWYTRSAMFVLRPL